MRDQVNSPHRYPLGLVFPPWDGQLPWALLRTKGAAPEAQQR